MEEKGEKMVSWRVFTWVMGIVTLLIGILFQAQAALSGKVETISDNNIEIRTQLSQIQTDILWIKRAMGGEEK